eukprot:gene11346-15211_t
MNSMNIGETSYWEARYAEDIDNMMSFELFDWYCPFSALYEILVTLFEPTLTHKVLVIGCGRSDIIDCLYKKGFRDITCIDISNRIIGKMQQKYESYSGVEFMTMDVRDLIKFNNETFTLIFDKACIDTLFCRTDFHTSVNRALNEIYRVLKWDGLFVSVSYATSLSRVPHLRSIKWAIDCVKIPPEIGEGLTLYALNKTTNQAMLDRKVPGGEAIVLAKSSKVVSNLDQSMNKSSTVKSGSNTGSLTVTASVDVLANMVADSEVFCTTVSSRKTVVSSQKHP